MKYYIAFFLTVVTMSLSSAQSASFYTDADQFFKSHVTNGVVNYTKAKSGSALNNLIDQVQKADLAGKNAKQVQAFYINAYNLYVINKVISNTVSGSVLDVDGFFTNKDITVAGSKMSLNDLEKTKLIAKYGDARYHFVLVCGAIDCPPLASFAYTPAKLEQQLKSQTKIAMNSPTFIKPSGKISQLFDWYANDFGGKDKVLAYINEYRTSKLSGPASFYNYDWKLNGK